jgi:hypothetical protein
VREVNGQIDLHDGTSIRITPDLLTAESERALKAIAAAVVSLAVALVLLRVT